MIKNQHQQAAIPPVQSGYAAINGLSMYYEIHGEGAPFVLIHGGGSCIPSSFGRIIARLAKNRQVIALELQAHGRTSDRPGPERFEQDADDVAALLQFLKIPVAAVLGFSNGGNTAMQLAIRHPQLANKLVVASAFYKRNGLIPGFFEGMERVTLQHMPQPLKDAFLQVNPSTDKLQNMFDKDKQRMQEFKDWPESYLQAIKVPVLVIATDKDVATNEHTVELYRQFSNPHSKLLIVPGTHGCYFETAESSGGTATLTNMTLETMETFLDDK